MADYGHDALLDDRVRTHLDFTYVIIDCFSHIKCNIVLEKWSVDYSLINIDTILFCFLQFFHKINFFWQNSSTSYSQSRFRCLIETRVRANMAWAERKEACWMLSSALLRVLVFRDCGRYCLHSFNCTNSYQEWLLSATDKFDHKQLLEASSMVLMLDGSEHRIFDSPWPLISRRAVSLVTVDLYRND